MNVKRRWGDLSRTVVSCHRISVKDNVSRVPKAKAVRGPPIMRLSSSSRLIVG